jgi:signal transduction histidine kinase
MRFLPRRRGRRTAPVQLTQAPGARDDSASDLLAEIARLLADPEPEWSEAGMSGPDGDEILADLQRHLRVAQWHRARLAAVVAAMGRLSHDVRGILSPAMLAAERLQGSGDASVSRTGDMLIRSVERAIEALRETVVFARAGGPHLTPVAFALRPLLVEATGVLAGPRVPTVGLAVPDGMEIEADRAAIGAVFASLLRNAAQAGASQVRIAADRRPGTIRIEVADDGGGMDDAARASLFQPALPGDRGGRPREGRLGLAIARDLLRANGGDIALGATGPAGTVFEVTLSSKSRG